MSLKPQPRATAETLPFWKGCAQNRLLYQHCERCQRAQFPPRSRCAHCHADAIVWRESKRFGKVHTFTVVHRAPSAAFKDELPYVIVLVDLDEGFRMMMNWRDTKGSQAPGDLSAHGNTRALVDTPAEPVAIGQRVHIVFEHGSGDWPLPQAVASESRE